MMAAYAMTLRMVHTGSTFARPKRLLSVWQTGAAAMKPTALATKMSETTA